MRLQRELAVAEDGDLVGLVNRLKRHLHVIQELFEQRRTQFAARLVDYFFQQLGLLVRLRQSAFQKVVVRVLRLARLVQFRDHYFERAFMAYNY